MSRIPYNTILITHNGKTQSLRAWGREIGRSPATIAYRYHQGWPIEQIISHFIENKTVPPRLITYLGKTQTISAWSRELNITEAALRERIFVLGWSLEKAFSTPTKPPLAPISRIIEALPEGAMSGYYVFQGEEIVGEVYRLSAKHARWTHKEIYNFKYPHFSKSWSTRDKAIADLLEQLTIREAA